MIRESAEEGLLRLSTVDPDTGKTGTDLVLHIHDDGSMEVALRAGHDERWRTWGPGVELVAEPSEVTC